MLSVKMPTRGLLTGELLGGISARLFPFQVKSPGSLKMLVSK